MSMRKFFTTALVFIGLCASAQTFKTDDGLSYTVTSAADKTVEVAKPTPAYAIENVTIPATVTNGGVTYTVTGIADQAFMSNSTIVSLKISDGVKKIGKSAFQGCSKLEKVDMGNTIETLGDNAFFTSSKIQTLVLSKTVKTIGKWGLRGMSGLVSLTLSDDLEAVSDGMCWGNTKLKGITIPDKVTTIGENAFASCSAIDTIQLGASVTKLAGKAFAYVSNYKKITCRAAVPPTCGDEKSLGAEAVFGKATLYVKESSLEAYQKAEPWSKYSKILPYDPSGSLDDKFFVMAGIGYEMLSKDERKVAVAHIDTLVYKGNILVRPTVNYAGQDFNVVAVQPSAFKGCTAVTQVELPASIQNIGNEAFNGCSGMKYFIVKTATPPTLGTSVFTGIKFADCKLFATRESVAAYATAAQWKDFTNKGIILDEVTVDGLTYKSNNVIDCTLDFVGAKGFKGNMVIPDVVKVDGYSFYVTTIAGNSFYNTDVTALTLPKTLKSIAGSAFFTLGKYDRPIERIVVPEGVVSIGSNAFYGSHVNYVDLPKNSLKELAGSAFYSCDIKGIEIPGSVGVINGSTFYGSHMGWVILGEGITEVKDNAFFATNIGSLRLPSTMKTIGDGAFSSCSKLTSLTINNGLETVADNAFNNCNSLYKIFSFAAKMPKGLENSLLPSGQYTSSGRTTYSVSDIMKNGTAFGIVKVRSDLNTWFDYKGVRYLPSQAGSTDLIAIDATYGKDDFTVEVPQKFTANGKNYNVKELGVYLLGGQTVMTKVNVTNPITVVPNGFANYAMNLKEVSLPKTVVDLGQYCFAQTDSLATIDLPEGLTNIGVAAFYYSGLKELTVPANVTLMDNASFAGCRQLKKLVFADGNKSVMIGYFPTMFGNRPMFGSSKLDKIVIGRDLNYIANAQYGYSPFYNDSIVQHVEFTNAPTLINANLFLGCKSIRTITVGNGVKRINASAFSGCAAVDSVYLGQSVANIGTKAFEGCAKLTKLYSANPVPAKCGADALTDIDKKACTLFVPKSGINSYKDADQWKEFFNIKEYGFVGVEDIPVDQQTGRYVVYNLSGVLILDTMDESLVKELPSGIYIINGRKVIK